jgi:hypothetical protein
MEKGGSALCLKGAQAFLRVGVGALRSKLAELNIKLQGLKKKEAWQMCPSQVKLQCLNSL